MKYKAISRALALATLLLAPSAKAVPTNPDVWDNTYEAEPGATDAVSEGDDNIRAMKNEIRNRLEVEHKVGTQSSSPDNGLHREGSARCFYEATAPTDIAVAEYNNTGGTENTLLSATEAHGSQTIGEGRCWVRSTDNAFFIYSGTTWVAQNYGPNAIQGHNVVYNGSFEITDGTGATASTTTPVGWTNLNTSTIAYTTTAVSEGTGLALRTTAAGGANEGVRQALTGLRASTLYQVRVRVKPAAVVGGCNLNVSGGAVTLAVASTGTGAFETLAGQITTTAGPATVNLDLRSTADTNVCDWDHVEVFTFEATTSDQPGVQVCFDTDNTTASDVYTTAGTWVDALVSCAVTVPGPGYVIEVRGQVVGDNDSASNTALAARIRENGSSTVGMGSAYVSQDAAGANQFRDIAVVPVFYTKTNPTPGTTYTYTLEATPDDMGGNATFDRNVSNDGGEATADAPDSAAWLTTLEVRLVPTR